MDEALFTVSAPENEPVLEYLPGSPEREALTRELSALGDEELEIPLFIGGKEVRTGRLGTCVMPHEHGHVLARYHQAGPEELRQAVREAREGHAQWSRLPWPERVSAFLKAAELLAGPWRAKLNASTMLGVSKTVYQAEIDAACELADFLRFNAHFVDRIYSEQPASMLGIWDRLDWRPLEGFVLAISPFNFTSIAANLPAAPAMMGNTVLWKPASSAVYPAYWVMRLLQEAGVPPGVIQFVPGPGDALGQEVVRHPELAGIHFTGSTSTFQSLWSTVGANIAGYRTYPRLVGETGGKDFVVAHPSAHVESLVTALVRGAFEYQGQKCSAASRAYIPASLWPTVRERLQDIVGSLRMGDPRDLTSFMAAVIDERAYRRIEGYLQLASASSETELVVGGERDRSQGYFIRPAVVQSLDPHHRLMEEEIFGPVLTVYVYPDHAYTETLELCDQTSPYALTGAVFAQERYAIHEAHRALRYAAGNFYVNDKPTGAMVNQQPFGGSRASGTNDKAGSLLNLLRWVSPRTIKETFVPPTDYRYAHMQPDSKTAGDPQRRLHAI
ncbi:MAG: L-glutamate gamma-semialdehyde dehydrogenase [bacterium]